MPSGKSMGFQHHKWWFTTGDVDPSIKHGGSHGALKPWFQVVIRWDSTAG